MDTYRLKEGLEKDISFFFRPFSDHKLNRGSLEPEGIAKAIFQIALIGEVEKLFAVAENDEFRGLYAHLCHIVDL